MLGLIIAAALAAGSTTVREAAQVMMLPGMVVHFEVIDCMQINAGYFPPAKTIYLCRELLEYTNPGIIRTVVAHEMGHAIIDQYHIPFTGSEEAAADELAAVVMSRAGYSTDIMQTAVWFAEMAAEPGYTEDVRDEHPSLARRSWTLMCLADGSDPIPNDTQCAIDFARAERSWTRLIKLHEVAQ